MRPLTNTDCASLFELYSSQEVVRYGSFPAWTKKEDAHAYLLATEVALHREETVRLGIYCRNAGAFIGTCSLLNISSEHRRAEIGYALLPRFTGRGYMCEALGALLALALQPGFLNRIEADVDPRNLPSVRTLQRLGFKYEGLLRERWITHVGKSDSAMYGILAAERHEAIEKTSGN